MHKQAQIAAAKLEQTRNQQQQLIINPCPAVSLCSVEIVQLKNNRDLLQEIDNLRAALAVCNQQIQSIKD